MTKKELDSLQNRTFVLDFPMIQLKQEATDDAIVYSGPGSITQASNGDFRLKLYHLGKIKLSEAFRGIGVGVGEILPDNQYFSLTGTDCSGRKWTSEHITLSTSECFPNDAMIITGNLRSLQNEQTISREFKSAYLTLRFPKGVKIPFNARSNSVMTVEGERVFETYDINVAKFSASDFDFILWNDDYWLILEIQSNGKKFPPSFDIRICEALQFVLSKTLQWCVLERGEHQAITTIVKPQIPVSLKSRRQPPLQYDHIDDQGTVWKLFEKYLFHILSFNENKTHQLSGHVKSAIAASEGSLEAEALTVSVAIEGILREEFPEVGQLDGKDMQKIDDAKDLIEKFGLDLSIKKRMQGVLNAMKGARAADKLRKIVQNGLLEESLFRAWEKVRHRSAHSFSLDVNDIEKFYQLNNSVELLFNILVFLAIGYAGPYTDYGAKGWPTKIYNGSRKSLDKEEHKNQAQDS